MLSKKSQYAFNGPGIPHPALQAGTRSDLRDFEEKEDTPEIPGEYSAGTEKGRHPGQ